MNRPFHTPRAVICFCGLLAALGGGTLLTLLYQSPEQFWPNLLLVSFFLLCLGLAGIVFVALQYVTGAGWAVALRRVPEAMFAIIPVAGLGLLIVFLAKPSLYPWASASLAEGEQTPLHHAWFNQAFFLARAVAYLAGWVLLGSALVRNSRCQDDDSSLAYTYKNVRLSALFLVVFGVSFWLASQDWLMSLEPEWSSTIFAVYQFAGLFVTGLAAIILLSACLYFLGPFRDVLTKQHLHDLGKLLFGFSSFWMYLWFCQYMLIWYVNNPEETAYFTRRLQGDWGPLFFLNIILNWGIPFLILLPKAPKQSMVVLAIVSLVVLAGHWLDLYLGILPYSGNPTPWSAAWEAGLMLGAVGLFGLVFFTALGRAALVPLGDPFLLNNPQEG